MDSYGNDAVSNAQRYIMKLVFISDTHLKEPDIPECDVLIHSGDGTFCGDNMEIRQFYNWFQGMPAKHKIFVPGNHDWLFESDDYKARHLMRDRIFNNHVLINQEVIINGIKFYGSPWQPEFGGWAFNLSRLDDSLRQNWKKIPNDVNVLITHSPPKGILDTIEPDGEELGCYDLKQRAKCITPKYHCFGHIHGGYGHKILGATEFINASVVNERYELVNAPIVREI